MKYKIKKYRNGNTVEWNTGPKFIPNPLPIEKPEDSPENIIDRSLGLMNPYEGFRSKVYDDKDPYRPYKGGKPKGTLTIGYGLTNPDIIKSYMNKEMDEQTSNNYQREYINSDIIPALEKTSYYANLNPDQKASLISLVYNVGPTTFFKRSPKLQAALGANDWPEAVKHMDHGINQFEGLKKRRQAEQGTFMGDSVWTGNEYIPKYLADRKYLKLGGKIRKHQIGQTVNWSTEPQGWKAYDEYKAKQNQIDFQNKIREANNPANNPLINKPVPVANQDWRNQDTYSNWQSRQRAKQAKYEQSAPYKIGTRLKEGAQVLSGSLGHFGMNIPFDIARSAGAKIPETMFSPTAFNDVNPNQSVGDFTKQIIGRGADLVSFDLGMGMIPGLVGGKALRNATPGMLTNNPVGNVKSKIEGHHLQGDDALKMFKQYKGVEPANKSGLYKRLEQLAPEARIRYGLEGNSKITDKEITDALYKKALEMQSQTGSANINSLGEPRILFRGDTRRYTHLPERISPNDLANTSGTMDNSLGTLFLGDLPTPRKGTGLNRYLVTADYYARNTEALRPPYYNINSSTTGSNALSLGVEQLIPESDIIKRTTPFFQNRINGGKGMWVSRKIHPTDTKYGANDVNPFFVNTKKVRNATEEIPVLNEFLLTENGKFYGTPGDDSRKSFAKHFQTLLDKSKANNEGLLKSDSRFKGNNFRNEHDYYDYFALPNYNKENAKHLFQYDLRKKVDWKNSNIYKSLAPIILGSSLYKNNK